MSRDPGRHTAIIALGLALLHRKAPLLQARSRCRGGARQSATLGLLRKMLGWTYRPSDRRVPDNLSDHMLRDIGIGPDGREDEGNIRFWRRRRGLS